LDEKTVGLLEQILLKLDDIKSDTSWISSNTSDIDDLNTKVENILDIIKE